MAEAGSRLWWSGWPDKRDELREPNGVIVARLHRPLAGSLPAPRQVAACADARAAKRLARLYAEGLQMMAPTTPNTPTRRQPLLVFVPDSTGRRESVKPMADFLSAQAPFDGASEPLICDFRVPWGWGHKDLSSVCSIIATQID